MSRIRILIVEDEPIIAADLADRLRDMDYDIAGQCSSGEEALQSLEQEKVDLILMDIQLEGAMDGIETAQRMLLKQPLPLIYLTSNSDETTFSKAKTTHPAAFLTKPFRGKDLQHAIELAISRVGNLSAAQQSAAEQTEAHLFKDRLFVKVKDRMVRIFLKEILWLEADDYYSKLITKEREYLITQPLKQMGESLAERPEFMRIHRSFIVNLTQIEEIGDVFVTIHNRQIPLNKTSKDELTAQLLKI